MTSLSPSSRSGRVTTSVLPLTAITRKQLSRNDVVTGLLILGFVSAVTDRVVTSIHVRGFSESVINTFDVSAIVFGSCWFAISLLRSGKRYALKTGDGLLAALAIGAFVIPVSMLNWAALTCVAIYSAMTSESRSSLQRGAWIFLAVTFTMFWSPRIFAILSDWILATDAELVSRITGTVRVGNTVQLRDGTGFLWIAPACSSMANVSLAVLCWTSFGQLSDRSAGWRDIGWCVLACLCVVTFNVMRIALIGLYPGQYAPIHGPMGTLVASYATLIGIVGICILWKRRELFPAA